MACEIIEYKRVMLVLWGRPELRDFENILSRLVTLSNSVGPVVFIARVPATAAPPDDKMRKEISRILPLIVRHCTSYHAVFEGGGFANSAKRAVLSTMFLMSAGRKRYHVHSLPDDVAGAVAPDMQKEVIHALDHFRGRGMLDHTLESVLPPASGSFGRAALPGENPNPLMRAKAAGSLRHDERGR